MKSANPTRTEPVLTVDTSLGGTARPDNGVATYVVLITRTADDEQLLPDALHKTAIKQVHDELQTACDEAGLGTWFKVMGRLVDGEYVTTEEVT